MAYFPNGTAGLVLDEQCANCRLADDAPCPILWAQMEYNYTQLNEGEENLKDLMNFLVDSKGNCKMKPLIDEI